jgi:hypothetical protein
MTEIICPLCGKPNPPELDECQYCQAPLKTGGFLAPAEEEGESDKIPPFSEETDEAKEASSAQELSSNLEQAIPDWLKETEAGFLDQSKDMPEESTSDEISEQIDALINQPSIPPQSQESAMDDDWLASLLAEAGAGEPDEPTTHEEPAEESEAEPDFSHEETEAEQEVLAEEEQPLPQQPVEKPDWLSDLEASSTIKLEGGMFGAEQVPEKPAVEETPEEESQEQVIQPDWLTKAVPVEPQESPEEKEEPIAAADLPTWLEALRPKEATSPSGPIEDVSGADIVTAGPLAGLRGVISAQPSVIRAQKPPSYSIKLRVTEEQQARMQMMEELLADEGKPKPLPVQRAITSQYIFRLVIAVVLLLPVVWMVISKSQQTSPPQPGNIPGVVDFTQRIQMLPSGSAVLVAFDYEAGFAGEMNLAVTNVITQLMNKSAYLTLVATTPSGPAMAESVIKNASESLVGSQGIYLSYANLGYVPGGTMGLLGLVTSPRSILPYSLDGKNVWAETPLNSIIGIEDFSSVIVMTNDPDTARIWIEQVGPQLQKVDTPLLIVTSSQAEPLLRPYYDSTPAQVQGLIAGLAGGIAYARTVGNTQNNGVWDAFSAGITMSVLIILVGSIAGIVVKMLPANKKTEK